MGFFGGGGSAASDMVGATTSTAGTAGLVPAPAAGKNTRALMSDASFGESVLVPQNKPANTLIIKAYSHAQSQNSGQFSSNKRVFMPIFVPADGNIAKLCCRTGAGTYSVAINFNLAFWECGEDGKPSTYMNGANITSGTTSGASLEATISSTAVKRGFYYISLTPDASIPSNGLTVNNSYSFGSLFAGIGSVNDIGVIFSYTYTTYDQTTHNAFEVGVVASFPALGFKYA